MNSAENSTIILCRCGQNHADQVAAFPAGATVRLLADFGGVPPYDFPAGTAGRVTGHCPDGRALIVLGGVNAGHTWHSPADYVEVAELPQRSAASGAPCDDSGPARIIGAENAPTQPRGCNAQETASDPWAKIENVIRQEPLAIRLEKSRTMIAKMCKERRPPKMSIPLQPSDEDQYICTTLKDALALIEGKELAESVAVETLTENQALAVPLAWTKETPTMPGAYFFRAKDGDHNERVEFQGPEPRQVEIYATRHAGELRAFLPGIEEWFGLSNMHGEWAGPIAPPARTINLPAKTAGTDYPDTSVLGDGIEIAYHQWRQAFADDATAASVAFAEWKLAEASMAEALDALSECHDRLDARTPTAEECELLDALADMVEQYGISSTFYPRTGTVRSGGISAHADAMRLLGRYGRMRIVSDDGNRGVVAEWITQEDDHVCV